MPVYHQVAAVVRWEVRAGRLPIGSALPPVRRVAAALGINFHTARRAWEELAADGTISLRRGRGARVERVPADTGWNPAPASGSTTAAALRLWVVSGSLEQSARLAVALSSRWEADATAWPLGASAPPPGLILLAEVAPPDAWSEREGDLRKLELALEPNAIALIREAAAARGLTSVALVGGGEQRALVELRRQLPRLGLPVGEAPDLAAALEAADTLVLVAGPAWDRLEWASRVLPRVIPLEFGWAASALARVGVEVRSKK